MKYLSEEEQMFSLMNTTLQVNDGEIVNIFCKSGVFMCGWLKYSSWLYLNG